jgi:hypothetical protein
MASYSSPTSQASRLTVLRIPPSKGESLLKGFLMEQISAATRRAQAIDLRFRKTPGFKECPGSYMGDHIKGLLGRVGECRYCHNQIQMIHYGKNLKGHYVPEGRS